MIDRMTISVTGMLQSANNDPDSGNLLDYYRSALLDRVSDPRNNWKAPSSNSTTKLHVSLQNNPLLTIRRGRLFAELDNDVVKFRLRLVLNPTRTLKHQAELIEDSTDARTALTELGPDEFFAWSNSLQQLQSVDGNDNFLDRLCSLRTDLSEDFPTVFFEIYERQLKRWVSDAVLPPNTSNISITLHWPEIVVSSVEGYFERRHSDAYSLLERLAREIETGHIGAHWRSYGINETRERRKGAIVVGLDFQNNVEQKYYAKTKSRVRLETTYTREVRKTLKLNHGPNTNTPLQILLAAVRRDVVRQCKYDVFCEICAEPKRATLQEATEFIAQICHDARGAKVNPAPVLAALLSTGGINETDKDGAAPKRLMRRLARSGIIKTSNLRPRRRPHAPIRHRLHSQWRDVAVKMQKAFVSDHSET